jgi:drug/metabolite transporter (DMT)-like permease
MQDRPGDSALTSHAATPLICLLGVVALLTSVTLVIKYVFQHSDVQPMALASVRIAIGFALLCGITLLWDWRGLLSLAPGDVVKLTLVGILGVFSYAIAACGLMRTSVTHYALIYSLLPSATALFSVLIGREQLNRVKVAGIGLSLGGCIIAVASETLSVDTSVGIGDALVLLFTVMMSAHIVFSAGTVKRFGVMVANTVMFGSSALIMFVGSWKWGEPRHEEMPFLVLLAVTYVGLATAGVFLLRYRALQALPPATVATYHNLIPICTIFSACLLLGEHVSLATIIGSVAVVAGTELVRRTHLPVWIANLHVIKWIWRPVVSRKPSP